MSAAADTIEGSGFPLAFRVRQGTRAGALAGVAPGETTYRVEARTLGAHQKEAVVTQGTDGCAWRVTSDEGAHLHGSDRAPFPLGFFNAGLQADLIGRLTACASARGIAFRRIALELTNRYAFDGSFYKGTGRGSAEPPEFRLALEGDVAADAAAQALAAAVRASPVLAAVRTRLANTFALYVNGARREVDSAHASGAPDARDPLKSYAGVPSPLAGADDEPALIERLGGGPAGPVAAAPAASRVDIVVQGTARLVEPAGTTDIVTWLERPAGTRFRLVTDERARAAGRAPTGLALAAAGIAFCYLTQLVRYAEYLKYRVRAIRLVQSNPFRLAGESLAGGAAPVDTHLFLHGDEPDEVMQRLLAMGANTCYLHATLSDALEPRISATLNGAALET